MSPKAKLKTWKFGSLVDAEDEEEEELDSDFDSDENLSSDIEISSDWEVGWKHQTLQDNWVLELPMSCYSYDSENRGTLEKCNLFTY